MLTACAPSKKAFQSMRLYMDLRKSANTMHSHML